MFLAPICGSSLKLLGLRALQMITLLKAIQGTGHPKHDNCLGCIRVMKKNSPITAARGLARLWFISRPIWPSEAPGSLADRYRRKPPAWRRTLRVAI
jgi:hypothetical protein